MTGAGPQHLRAVADLVAVMDRLRSPGGCPWDAEQTHESLVRYALEEAYEVAEAIEDGDRTELRQELGDLLLQVVFHARIATEHPTDPFDLDDVAAAIAAKLRRRHPHVFGPAAVSGAPDTAGAAPASAPGTAAEADAEIDAAEVRARWDRLKLAEDGRDSVFDGVPAVMPALARAQKVLGRARRAGLTADLPGAEGTGQDADPPGPEGVGTDTATRPAASGADDAPAALARRLLGLVADAESLGVDAEQALRAAVRSLEKDLRDRERASTG